MPAFIYVSPALRCVQTAVGLLKGMANCATRLCIEPALFEWGGWFRQQLPSWMTPDELAGTPARVDAALTASPAGCAELGYPVDKSYKPMLPAGKLNSAETLAEYYERSFEFARRTLDERHANLGAARRRAAGGRAWRAAESGTVLFVAHGASLDTCTRQLCGQAPRSQTAFYEVLHSTPYLGACGARGAARRRVVAACCAAVCRPAGRRWQLCDPPILPFKHQANTAFDWRVLQ